MSRWSMRAAWLSTMACGRAGQAANRSESRCRPSYIDSIIVFNPLDREKKWGDPLEIPVKVRVKGGGLNCDACRDASSSLSHLISQQWLPCFVALLLNLTMHLRALMRLRMPTQLQQREDGGGRRCRTSERKTIFLACATRRAKGSGRALRRF
jgi:hypothetical protein